MAPPATARPQRWRPPRNRVFREVGRRVDDHFPLGAARPRHDADEQHLVPGGRRRLSAARTESRNVEVGSCRPSSSAAAASNWRSAAAVRPWRPITRPRSPAATCSSNTVPPRRSIPEPLPRRPAGRPAPWPRSHQRFQLGHVWLRLRLRRGRGGLDGRGRAQVARQVLGQQRAHRIRRTRALRDPMRDALAVDFDHGRLGARVVETEDFDEPALARRRAARRRPPGNGGASSTPCGACE